LESVDAMLLFRPESVVQHISPRAALWIYAQEDTVIPIEESQNMYRRALEPKKLVAIEKLKHYELYHGEGFERVMGLSTSWFNNHL
jgi:hypothetical protein